MITSSRGCPGFAEAQNYSRRDILRVGSLSGLGLSLGNVLRMESAQGAQKWFEREEGSAKSVIQIILPGGIAAQETWNPKPEAPLEYRGPFGFHKTNVPTVENLPGGGTGYLSDKYGAFGGGGDPARDAVPLCDLHSTIYKLVGINSQKELMAPGDRPIELVNEGKPATR